MSLGLRICFYIIFSQLKEECKDLSNTPGFLVNCLIEHRHTVNDQRCRSFLTKMSAIIFEDYRLIKGFYDNCVTEVKKTNCGQLSKASEDVVSISNSSCIIHLEWKKNKQLSFWEVI